MNIQDFVTEMRETQTILLNVLDNQDDFEENFLKLQYILEEQNIKNDQYDLELFLRLLLNISNNHHRKIHFFEKIERILRLFKEDILKYYSNRKLINIFASNKRILLFLLEEDIIKVDYYFFKKITTKKFIEDKYPQYFAPEIKSFINENLLLKKDSKNSEEMIKEIEEELPENFEINRKIGENENTICKLIRNDSIKEFDTFVNKLAISLDSPITSSIYETNCLLIKNSNNENEDRVTLIEYAAFFGSIQIFQYLRLKGVELNPSLWLYAIHSGNPELIHLLESNAVFPEDKSCTKFVNESIKCHENQVTNYFQENYLENKDENQIDIFIQSIEYFNFSFINEKFINESFLYYFCRYGYYLFAKIFLKYKECDVNKLSILKAIF